MNKTIRNICLALSAFSAAEAVQAGPQRPNVVFIYGDDVGYADVSAYSKYGGDGKILTPNIDALAAGGKLFTDAHSSSATCSPSRFSMLTGVWSFRNNVSILPPDAPLSIPVDKITLPKMFKRAGYRTAVIGKWHLGIGKKGTPVDWNGEVQYTPNDVGFDYSFIIPSTNDRVPCVFLKNRRVFKLDPSDPLYVGTLPEGAHSTVYPDAKKNPEAMTFYKSISGHKNSVINGIGRIGYMWGGKAALWCDDKISETLVGEAQKYIVENKDKPFFLYFASQCIHCPRVPAERFRGKSGLGYRGDSMLEFDWVTGEIIKTLKENGLWENTIIVFSSDNGPVNFDAYDDGTGTKTRFEEVSHGHDASGLYRGGKYQIYEGGTRVPLIISWPGHIAPGVFQGLVNQIDFLASFAKLVGVSLKPGEAPDSRDTLDMFLGTRSKGLQFTVEEARHQLALRYGEWKYIPASSNVNKKNKKKRKRKKSENQLYNLKNDIGERHNVFKENPEIVKNMQKILKNIIESGKSEF